MNSTIRLAAMIVAGTLAALVPVPATAQSSPMAAPAVDVPKHHCGEKPEWPGKLASANMKRGFDNKLKAFGDCIRAYVEDRKAVIRANEVVTQAAIDEYNGVLAKAKADREAEQPK